MASTHCLLLLLLLLLFVLPTQTESHDEQSDCRTELIPCFNDCCHRNFQFCNSVEKRCTRCEDKQHQCGTHLEPVGCQLHCYLLKTTTPPTTAPTATLTSTTTTQAPAGEDGIFLPTYVIIVIAVVVVVVVVLFAATMVFICVILRKRKAKQQKGNQDDEEAANPLNGNKKEATDETASSATSKSSLVGRPMLATGDSGIIDGSITSEQADVTNLDVRDDDAAGRQLPQSARDGGTGAREDTVPIEPHREISTLAGATPDRSGPGHGRSNGSSVRPASQPDPGGTGPLPGNNQNGRLPTDRNVRTVRGSSNLADRHGRTFTNFPRQDVSVADGNTPPEPPPGSNGIPELDSALAVRQQPAPQHPAHCRDERLSRIIPTSPANNEHNDPPLVHTGTANPAANVRGDGY